MNGSQGSSGQLKRISQSIVISKYDVNQLINNRVRQKNPLCDLKGHL